MVEEQGFLRAIAETPKNEGLRLIYADWLEERGDPRAELIRVWQAMRATPVWSDRYWELKARRNELWVHCPLDWLEATGYDGSFYDPVFRDGVPAGWRERWRLIREFTERWHGIDVPDVGGRAAEVRQAEERLGLTLPPSLREYLAYVHDLANSSPSHDPRQYTTLFHCAASWLAHLPRHAAVSLIYYTLSDESLGVAYENLSEADPRTSVFAEAPDEIAADLPPPRPRSRPGSPISPSRLSLAIFQNLFIELPTAGNMEARGARLEDWLPRLAADFPIHARFDDAHVFETEEMLVLVHSPGGFPTDHLVEAVLRRPVPFASVPPYLFGGTQRNMGSSGMLGPEWFRRQLEAETRQPGARRFIPWWDGRQNLAHFGIETYDEWLRYSGRYPAWLSMGRRRELERLRQRQNGPPSAPPLPPSPPPLTGNEEIPF